MSQRRKDGKLELRVAPTELAMWRAEAERLGLALSAWVRMQCLAAVDRAEATMTRSVRR